MDPLFRESFLLGDRSLEVYFYTSNVEKFLQARFAFARAGLRIHHFKSSSDPYREDYALGKERLLANAINEIEDRIGRSRLFFVEDTSLRIEALSGLEDYPGLSVKEWFAATSFRSLDRALRANGDVRRAVVKSDIALHVPGLRRPVYFHGETVGEIPKSSPRFEASIQYPWLTPLSFNGWFVPDGARKRLGEMAIDESIRHDFRIRSLTKLLERLEEYAVVVNIPPPAYSRRTALISSLQSSLWPRAVYAVIGNTCAGKTTLGDRASELDFLVLEASSVMRSLAADTGATSGSPFEMAARLLRERGQDVVARRVLQLIEQEQERNIIITGFRTIEEIEFLKAALPETVVVVVEASERTRFQRHLERGRTEGVTSIDDFRKLDSEQGLFGLLRVAEDFADIKIINEGTKDQYLRQVEGVITEQVTAGLRGVTRRLHPRQSRDESQTYHCLKALEAAGRPLDCKEIDFATERAGHKIRYNNANKVLKRIPGLAQRIDSPGARVRYEILSAGRAYLRYMDRSATTSGVKHEDVLLNATPEDGRRA